VKELVERALAFHTLSIADLVAIFEDARPEAPARRREVLALFEAHPQRRHGLVAGITGTPGSGKSTLIGKLALDLATRHGLSVGVVAVDPASLASGGALLGDRVRVRFPVDKPQLYFRSQSSESELGGLGPDTFQVSRLLHYLFDVVFVETVGIGQSEVDVRWLSDRMYLVLQPLAGDEIQMLKAGIMEVPDAIVVNKCDEQRAARRLMAQLTSALPLSRPFGDEPPPLFATSATTGEGIDALADDVASRRQQATGSLAAKEAHFFGRWVKLQWGRVGERFLVENLGGAASFLHAAGGFEEAEQRFDHVLRQALAGSPVPTG
jgi:LAO/AO transport system kinase